MNEIGYRIGQVRKLSGVSQADLCRRAGLNQPNLSNIEKGKKDVTVSTLVRIARAIGVSPAEFFQEPPAPQKLSASTSSRNQMENLAEAICKNNFFKLSAEEENIARLYRMILPEFSNSKISRTQIQSAWFKLKRTLSAKQLSNLRERVRDYQMRRRDEKKAD